MSFKRNDIVNKQRLRDALEEETAMGFAHNDIVTTYAMDKAIAEGGGGGGGDFSIATVTFINSADDPSDPDLKYAVWCPTISNNEIVLDENNPFIVGETPVEVSIPLYQGKTEFNMIQAYQSGAGAVCTGGVSFDNGTVTVTGDGSITLKGGFV